jgi:hypothetical protein
LGDLAKEGVGDRSSLPVLASCFLRPDFTGWHSMDATVKLAEFCHLAVPESVLALGAAADSSNIGTKAVAIGAIHKMAQLGYGHMSTIQPLNRAMVMPTPEAMLFKGTAYKQAKGIHQAAAKAILALARLGVKDLSSAPALTHLLEDPEQETREVAAAALQLIKQ